MHCAHHYVCHLRILEDAAEGELGSKAADRCSGGQHDMSLIGCSSIINLPETSQLVSAQWFLATLRHR